jgi:hypothetical protein
LTQQIQQEATQKDVTTNRKRTLMIASDRRWKLTNDEWVQQETEIFSFHTLWQLWQRNIYPLVICYITMENHHRNSEFFHEQWWIFP